MPPYFSRAYECGVYKSCQKLAKNNPSPPPPPRVHQFLYPSLACQCKFCMCALQYAIHNRVRFESEIKCVMHCISTLKIWHANYRIEHVSYGLFDISDHGAYNILVVWICNTPRLTESPVDRDQS